MFRIRIVEADDPEQIIDEGVERMWVIVLGRIRKGYGGILDNQPAVLVPGNGTLDEGMAIEFDADHVINLSKPPRKYLEQKHPGHFLRKRPRGLFRPARK